MPVIVFQHLLNVALAVAIYLFVMRRLGDRFVAIGAAILFAIDTPTLHYANKILTETLFTALLFVVFALVVYARKLPLAGLLTGVLVLIRPVAIAYFVVVALCLLLRRVPLRTIAIYVALALRPAGRMGTAQSASHRRLHDLLDRRHQHAHLSRRRSAGDRG